MKEGNQIVSPVFKKRFARRKTTHRPFTFARNFETEGTASAAQNQIINQVGDRGVVITSPIQLSKSGEGLTISDIVRQSPVPVLIAHSTSKEKQKEDSEQEDNEEANTSLLRRSFRSREPSEQFLSRRQYPHGTQQQHAKVHHTPDEHYIGSKNTSNIDAEVSFADEDGQTGRRKKSTTASFSKSSKRTARAQTGQKSVGPDAPDTVNTQIRNTSQSEDSRAKNTSTKRGSNRNGASASAKPSTSSRKGRGQAVLERTPSPQPSVQEDNQKSSDKTKKLAVKSKSPPLSRSKKTRGENISLSSNSSKKSATKSKTPSPSLSKGKKGKTVSVSNDKLIKSSRKKTSPSSESVPLRRIDKTPQSRNTSLSQKNKAKTFSQGNKDQNLSTNKDQSLSAKTKTFSRRSEQKEKVMSLNENEETTPSPSALQSKRSKTAESLSTDERKEHSFKTRSSIKRGSHSILETSTKSSASRQADLSQDDSMTLSSTKKRKPSAAGESVHVNVSTRLSSIKENEAGNKLDNAELNGAEPEDQVRAKVGKDTVKSSSALHRRRIISEDDADFETQGPSPEKRARRSRLQKSETSVIQNQSVRQESCSSSGLSNSRSRREKPSLLVTSNSQSTKKNQRNISRTSNLTQNGKDSQPSLNVHTRASRSKVGQISQPSKPSASSEGSFSGQGRSSEKLAANEIVGERTSPRKRAASSNSFWKTSRRNESSLRPKRQKQAVLESPEYDDDRSGGPETGSVSAPQKPVQRNAATRAGRVQRKSDRSSEEGGRKRRHTAVTELGVIMTMLEDTETEIMEDYTIPRPCQNMLHKAFTFTRKQLQETESQVNQISELTYEINKLKSVCKAMSSESKENLQQKFILQKELQSLKDRGIDADMMRIDQWLQDFEAFRKSTS